MEAAAEISKKKGNTLAGRYINECICLRHKTTGQHWLVQFDGQGIMQRSCHVDWASDLEHLHFSKEYNNLLEAEAHELEIVKSDLW